MRKSGKFFHNRSVFLVFGFATWWTLIVPMMFNVYLWTEKVSEVSMPVGNLQGDAFAVVIAVTMAAFLANYFGMRAYLNCCDDSRGIEKTWWALGFFFTAPIATIPYFFLVYPSQFSASSRLRAS